MELVGKLTPRSMGWTRNAIGSATETITDKDQVLLGRIVGIVSGLKQTVNADTGEVQNGLKGNFRGVSSKNVLDADGKDTGKPITLTAGVCYLPGGIQEMVEGALAQAKEADAKATVQFALDLFAIKSSNKAGYSFKANNIVAAGQVDPLAALLEEANRNAALLTDQSEDGTGTAMETEPREEAPATGAGTDAVATPPKKGATK